jgi:hypothetical protein
MSEESHGVTVHQAQEWSEHRVMPPEMALKYELKWLVTGVLVSPQLARRREIPIWGATPIPSWRRPRKFSGELQCGVFHI